jgi:Zn-dependent M28 family amino/carboxypeptidase
MSELGITPRQKVRFAFWGAEESGLLGSEHYVENLTDEELQAIWANLNFDMVGSPDYVRFVYDGDGSATDPAGPPAGIPYDPCYHQACDDITNLSTKALFELGDAAAHAVLTLARTRSGFFEDGSRITRTQTAVKPTHRGPQASR